MNRDTHVQYLKALMDGLQRAEIAEKGATLDPSQAQRGLHLALAYGGLKAAVEMYLERVLPHLKKGPSTCGVPDDAV